uniref:ABC transporter domain-containing protein n=1 Tax=Timema tahoe TaxID=61484 RepID=A0A7R9FIM9_9NEOP|nr:unnamed protein product [Timema tahoe]
MLAHLYLVELDRTSLLQVLLGELPLSKGTCFLKGKLSYACQDSWVFGSTIRQNIVFGSPFDQKRYDEVVAVCALLPDIEQFPERDMTYIGERGITLSGGQKARINLARAIYKEADVYILDDPLSAVDTHVGEQLFEDCISSYLANKTRILVTHQLQYIKSSHNIILLKNGFIEMQGTFEYFQTCGVNYAQLLGVDLNNEPEETGEEEKENNERLEDVNSGTLLPSSSENNSALPPTVNEEARAGDIKKTPETLSDSNECGPITSRSPLGCEWVENEGVSLSPPTDLKEGSSKGKITGSIYMQYLSSGSGYLGMIWMALTTLLLQFAVSTTDYWMAYWVRQEELRDYRQMYDKMQNSTYNRSYILMDEETAEGSYIMSANMCTYIYSALIISIYLFTIAKSVAFVIGLTRSNEVVHNLMFKRVINTNTRFFDTNPSAKSPVFTHLQATLRGLSTIRAYEAQNILKAEFDNYQWGMKQSTELSNNMMSVERILEYTHLEEEPMLASTPDKNPPEEWPKEGEIQLEHTFLKYAQNESYVLKDINITIKPKEKIGVVGRTGAGKSSLITALLRLAPLEGTVRIDGLDTKDIGLQDLRSRISTIPQDPILFSRTLRQNLDPFGKYQDCDLWRVLEDVELKELFHHSEGLDTKVTESGRNFSVGQRQLICLARAILRNNKIILLDEATANVDIKTDNLIQNTIRQKFMNCTVLTVAHRLNTIMDSDRVIVMSNGRVEEVDHPHILLRNEEGTFSKMVDKVGPSLSRQLAMVAEKSITMPLKKITLGRSIKELKKQLSTNPSTSHSYHGGVFVLATTAINYHM